MDKIKIIVPEEFRDVAARSVLEVINVAADNFGERSQIFGVSISSMQNIEVLMQPLKR